MRLEALTVSINYSDYLQQIATNRMLFDRWLIVTRAADAATHRVCCDNGLESFDTSVPYTPGVLFPKGRMLNEGLGLLSDDTWILILDSDMVLPCNTRYLIETKYNDPRRYYATDNRLVGGNCIRKNYSHAEGFFQLFHSSCTRNYPCESLDGAEDDLRFALTWPADMRQVITDILPVHLGKCGLYRRGRTPQEQTKKVLR